MCKIALVERPSRDSIWDKYKGTGVSRATDKAAAVVLVVDDVGAIVDELLTLLQLQGIVAIGGQTLAEAIALLENAPNIRVIACDVRLDGESGLDIVSRIGANEALAGRVFHYVFITGDPMHAEGLRVTAPHSVLTKPVQPRKLVELIRKLLADEGDR